MDTSRPAQATSALPMPPALLAPSIVKAATAAPIAPRSLESISCIVPCRNEAANLARLIPELRGVLASLAPRWEIILVDDGSTDDTARLAPAWGTIAGVRVIQLSRNFGKEAALTAGLEAAGGQAVVLMDADLQHPPDLLPRMVARWRAGVDMVYAVREHRRDEGWIKRVGTRLFYGLINPKGRFTVPAGAGDFRLMDRAVVRALRALPERNRFMKGLYAWLGFDAEPLPYMPQARAHGTTHYNLLRLVRLSLDGLTAFTTWPLRVAGFVGFVLAFAAFGYGSYLTVGYLVHGHELSGWTTIVVGLALLSGVQLVCLGILGEYLGRVFEEVKGRPLYLVKRQWGRGLEADEA